MSGHSKWSKVKHQKATTDVAKAQAFTKAMRGLYVAIREGGGIIDPDKNFRLRLAIEKARYANVPKDTIDRAIAKASGEDSSSIESVVYEGYGPGGVAFLVSAVTDNRVRTVSVIKNLFDRHGGTLASPGAVMYLFSQKGIAIVRKNTVTMEVVLEHALNAGADDVVEREDVIEVYTGSSSLDVVKTYLEAHGIPVDTAGLVMVASTKIAPPDEEKGSLRSLLEALEKEEDVHEVYTNLQ
jgi:YebC/PmpR family DNA-binding regulatory protein